MKIINPIQISRPIDSYGMVGHRRAVTAIQKRHGAEERKAAAQAKRDRRAAKRTGVINLPEFLPRRINGGILDGTKL